MRFKYKIYSPSEIDFAKLHSFIIETEKLLTPSISSRVDIEEYCNKLHKHATIMVATDESDEIYALNAFYVNKRPLSSHAVFLAVKELYEGYGLGAKLIIKAYRYCKDYGSEAYCLKMRKSNQTMLLFYKRLGFEIISEEEYPNSKEIQVELKLSF